MKTTILLSIATLLLVPAGGALAASSGDPFAGYQRAFGGGESAAHATSAMGAQGPAGPTLAAACGRDPFTGYRQAFNAGGPAQTCGATATPSAMASAWSDPFQGYRRGLAGE
jgi:hypothetical protein